MPQWLTQGAADRSFARPDALAHLLVHADDGEAGWHMWCSAGRARPGQWPYGRLCRRRRGPLGPRPGRVNPQLPAQTGLP